MQPARHAAIRRARQPLPARALDGASYRHWAARVCAAEARHAAEDFWSAVHRLGLAALFDRDERPARAMGQRALGHVERRPAP